VRGEAHGDGNPSRGRKRIGPLDERVVRSQRCACADPEHLVAKRHGLRRRVVVGQCRGLRRLRVRRPRERQVPVCSRDVHGHLLSRGLGVLAPCGPRRRVVEVSARAASVTMTCAGVSALANARRLRSDERRMFTFKCGSCDEIHEGMPSFGFRYPSP
jgi:hypothetical protein